jgi:hypothetical protein
MLPEILKKPDLFENLFLEGRIILKGMWILKLW